MAVVTLQTKELLLHLVRQGIGNEAPERMSLPQKGIDWAAVKTFAEIQGILAVALDGLNVVYSFGAKVDMPQELRLQWIGEVLANYEQRYTLYENAIESLAGFYNSHGFKMMVLKGYSCSLDWPRPNHRPCGDIDIWQFGQYRKADALLSKEKRIRIDKSHHHHTVFDWQGFMVENHYDFINVHSRKNNKSLEAIFKELGEDDTNYTAINGKKIYRPSANLHALFLMRHLVAHFASTSITLRQVLDWAFFVEKHTERIDWMWLITVLEEYHIKEFFDCINAICVGELGFDVKIFPEVKFLPTTKDKVLEDIMNPQFLDEPKGVLRRALYKFRRWQVNAWKQELCYKESRRSAFLSGIWNHLLKPSSI